MSVLARCQIGGCAWEQFRPTAEAADKQLKAHQQLRHAMPVLDGVTQLDGVKWREEALDAIRALASTGRDFTVYDVHEYGVSEPENPRSQWGQLARDVHRLRIAHPVGFDTSRRPDTKASSVRVWNRDANRCQECHTTTGAA